MFCTGFRFARSITGTFTITQTNHGNEGCSMSNTFGALWNFAEKKDLNEYLRWKESDICQNRHKGNEESRAAFDTVKDRLNLRQAVVLQFIREQGKLGATTDEIAIHFKTN